MKLYLAQHGEALSKEEDAGRPLSERGRRDVGAIAALAGKAGVRVARVWHSGKLRAEQTAQILAKVVLPRGKTAASIGGLNPNDAVEDFIADADVWQEDTLVVGHLPFMSRLVALLLVGDPGRELVRYSPGSIACLERSGEHGWVLLWMLRPDAVIASGDGENNP